MEPKLTLKKIIEFEDLSKILKKIEFRGLYNKDEKKIKPYKKVSFLKTVVYPPLKLGQSPTIKIKNKREDEVLKKKPITPSKKEVRENPRARSAKLRIIEKI